MKTTLKNITEKLGMIHEQDLDVEKRIIYLYKEINSESAEKTVKNLHFLDSTDGDILLYVNSPGGYYYDGMAIYDAIKTCKNTIIAHADGQCSSMASIIIQACTERIAGPHATLIVHAGSGSAEGTVHDVIASAEYDKVILEKMYEVYWPKMTHNDAVPKYEGKELTIKKFKNMLKGDVYLTAEQAVEMNLIDRIRE